MTTLPNVPTTKDVHRLDRVVIRFAGDSGDGMQLAGTQFTNTAALVGNDIATFPDFPAEIRAPAGTLAGLAKRGMKGVQTVALRTPDDLDAARELIETHADPRD